MAQNQLIPGKIVRVKQHGWTPDGKKKRLEKDYRRILFYPNLTTPTNNSGKNRPNFPRSIRRPAILQQRRDVKKAHKVALQDERENKIIEDAKAQD